MPNLPDIKNLIEMIKQAEQETINAKNKAHKAREAIVKLYKASKVSSEDCDHPIEIVQERKVPEYYDKTTHRRLTIIYECDYCGKNFSLINYLERKGFDHDLDGE